jgi:type III secretory pathway component EscT
MSKDKQWIIICLLTLIVALVDIPEVRAVAPDTKVRLEPADSVVGLNETFAVQVVIEEVNDLGAFQFELTYDSTILQVQEAALGDFIGSTGRSVVPVGPEVDNKEGKTTFGAINLGSGPRPSGMGVLATITFIAQGEGSTVLGLLEVQVLDTAANAQLVTVEGGRVVVRGAAAPTPVATAPAPAPTGPSTWAVLGPLLVALAVAVLAVLVLRRRPEE